MFQVFNSLNLNAYDLSVDMLDVHAVSVRFNMFDSAINSFDIYGSQY